MGWYTSLYIVLVFYFSAVGYSVTDPNDLKILNDFKNGLDNPELLKWPADGDDPCGPPSWPHVFCSNGRVTQIQVQNLGLKGSLPQNFNQLSKLYNIGLQRNKFNGKLPIFSGLSELEFAYLDFNEFDTIPSDFFYGLSSLRVLALDYNPLNKSTGWSIPDSLANSVQLTNLSFIQCNLVGPVPEYLGTLPSLMALKLSYNSLSGEIPANFGQSLMQILWLNDQADGGMTGPIDVVAKMVSLEQLWLHGNQFTGTIPEDIGALTSLKDLNLNRNQLVGLIPGSLANMKLDNLVLNNNQLMGPIPKFKAGNVSYDSNSFCQSEPGVACAADVNALLDFLGGMNYPVNLVSQWSGNDPCEGPWLGLTCNPNSKVSIINLPRHNLSGTLSPSIANLDSLMEIRLGRNRINGSIPKNFTELKSLRVLDLSDNNVGPPLPEFHDGVKLVIEGNPLLVGTSNHSNVPPSPVSSPPPESAQSPSTETKPDNTPPSPITHSSSNSSSSSIYVHSQPQSSKRLKLLIVAGIAAVGILVLMGILLSIYCCKKKKKALEASSSIVVHPRDPSDPENLVKIAVSNSTMGSISAQTATSSGSTNSGATENSHVIESGNLVISVQVLRKVTKNFAQENEVGRGGFGTVYKGELEDGTKIAVKRMEAGVMTGKAVDEFQAEIGVLSKVRHRHLVSLLGYSIEGSERLLVYEYMPHVMGKITTKVDVFSYGVVLMELLTGLTALDEERSEERRYLAEWFWRIKSSKEKLMAAIDPAFEANEETLESIAIIAELAGHCTAREPYHRPDMGHVVNVLSQLVEKWKPTIDESDCYSGIDYSLPLPQMLKVWQEAESKEISYTSLEDSKGSIPARPAGFADSFTSSDGR
ncbi:hypothetical protein Pint_31755 [Pistacia integerrima]|uniref:Uncharacterized protein n=1 Tax=Pistacia integerrima TaxID=434235 RepID=A0ACC0XQQ8_9ROSI|nr:hypothetical protein Pint_31755 [Pistacia integerrima]